MVPTEKMVWMAALGTMELTVKTALMVLRGFLVTMVSMDVTGEMALVGWTVRMANLAVRDCRA